MSLPRHPCRCLHNGKRRPASPYQSHLFSPGSATGLFTASVDSSEEEEERRRASFCPIPGAMRSLWKRLVCLLVGTTIYPAIFLVSVIIQYAQTSLPPAIEQQWKLRFCQTVFISGIILVRPVFRSFFSLTNVAEKNSTALFFSYRVRISLGSSASPPSKRFLASSSKKAVKLTGSPACPDWKG